MDSICIWVSSVRRTDFHTGEMRYQKYRFQCSYGDPYHYCTYFFMDHGISGRGTTRHRKCFCQTWTFLILSGLATGASWLCYFRALQIGDVDKVVPVDKSSAILSILLAFLFLHESISPLKLLCVLLIGAGTYLMITKKETSFENSGKKGWSWFFYALGSAVFASLTSILGKVGIENIDSNLGTAIRTIVVLIMAWIVVFVTKKQDSVRTIEHRELGFICLSGLATGASWLCYYRALQDGLASVVVPIDKLSILVTILFSYLVFHEKLGKKEAGGLVLIVVGTLGMLV